MPDELLRVEHLTVEYRGRRGTRVTAVDDVSFSVPAGRTLGLMGESGSGKSTIGRVILGLTSPKSGSVIFDGEDITAYSAKRRRALAADLRVIFQDPFNSFNPSLKVGASLLEGIGSQPESRARVERMLAAVGLPPSAASRYPGAFSGGQRQRLAIARALMTSPKLVVCDEAVSALDVSVQAQVLNLLRDLQRDLGLTYLFIGHDIDVVRYMSDNIAVLYRGNLVELSPSETISEAPQHPYTRSLIDAAPGRRAPRGEDSPPRRDTESLTDASR